MQDPTTINPAAVAGERIRSWRMVLGLTAKQLAERANVSTDTISRIETGTGNPSWRAVLAVTGALGQRTLLVDALDPLDSDVGRARAHLINRKRAR